MLYQLSYRCKMIRIIIQTHSLSYLYYITL
ncbi:hypothetical protein 7t3_0566 [Salmonella phage 7t3]|nr:hypothetical protein 7t3_0566 [Salmonella phage 7t3]